ncbi:MAG: hypothetical protein JXX14_02275 [Deltaproteobacteria bacterium]|nr:hypothetical protein [Deltaproteobacteria bacterium]
MKQKNSRRAWGTMVLAVQLVLLSACSEGSDNASDNASDDTENQNDTADSGSGGNGDSDSVPFEEDDSDTGSEADTAYNGPYRDPVALSAPAKTFSLESGYYCYLDSNHMAQCPLDSFWDSPPTVALTTLDVGSGAACGLDADGTAHCWFYSFDFEVPGGTFSDIAVGDDLMCGIRVDQTIECGGDDWNWAYTAPQGSFTGVSMADNTGCGIKTDGSITCWGELDESFAGNFVQIANSSKIVCGITSDGMAVCPQGDIVFPEGTYSRITVGEDAVCAIAADASIVCAGDKLLGNLIPPAGTFIEVSASWDVACALPVSGKVECWGEGAGDGESEFACASGKSQLEGTLMGADWSIGYSSGQKTSGSRGNETGFRFLYTTSYSGDGGAGYGSILMAGSDAVTSSSVTDGLENEQTVTVDKLLMQHGASAEGAGQFHCSTDDSTATLNVAELLVDFQGIKSIGACADGVSVAGGILRDDTADDEYTITLDGITPLETSGGHGCSGIDCNITMSEVGYFLVRGDYQTGIVEWAVLYTHPESEWGGAVYCTETGTVDDDLNMNFSNFYRLDCPDTPGSDAISGCMRD